MFVTTRTEMTPGGDDAGWYEVADIELPGDDQVCENDLALLVLAKPVLETEAKPITPGVQYLMWDPVQYGSTFTAIGYGVVSPAGDDAGTRRRLDFVSVICAVETAASEPAGLPFGSACTSADVCTSNLCIGDTDEARICTKACVTDGPCPEGHTRRASVCLPTLPVPPPASPEGDGCVSSGGSSFPRPGGSLALAMLAHAGLLRHRGTNE